MNRQYVIVGAGISGLYTAYKLIKEKKISGDKIVILEKSRRIGGRVYTYSKLSEYKYDVGAGRLGKKHKYVMKLIKELGLSNDLVPISKEKCYYIEGKFMNEKELIKHFGSSFTSLSECWKYAITAKSKMDPKYVNLETYFSSILSTRDVCMLAKSLGYISEMYEMNAYNALDTIRKDFDVENNDFYVMRNGIQSICDKLYELLVSKNVKFLFDTYLKDIKKNNNKNNYINILVETERKPYTISAFHLYITITRLDYTSIPFFKQYSNLFFDSVIDGKLMRIYAKYPIDNNSMSCWFTGLPKTITDNKLLFIIPIDESKGLIQISYSDSYVAQFWNSLTSERLVRDKISKYLQEIFPNKTIPEPEWLTFHYWRNGVHFWRPEVCSHDVQQQMYQEMKKHNIFIVGETFCNRQAWIDGALEMVHNVIYTNVKSICKSDNKNKILSEIDNVKYDLTEWKMKHPGGSVNITKLHHNNDASIYFNRCPFHNTEIKDCILSKYALK